MVEIAKTQPDPLQRDFIDLVKDYIQDTLYQLQAMNHIPEILKKGKPQKHKNKKNQEISWDFDSKEHAREKYGNFNTPIIMKLCSRFNRDAQKAMERNPEQLVDELTLANPQP